MKLALLALVSASLAGAGAAEAHQGRAHYNAASGQSSYNRTGSYSPPHAPGTVSGYSRAQTWHSDTGWQPGTSALSPYGYGYGYGGTGHQPPVILAAPYPAQVYSQPAPQVERSQPFGYVVDGYGRYPWVRQSGHGQAYSQPHGPAHGSAHGQVHGQAHAYPPPQPVYYYAAPVHVSQPPVYVQSPPVYVEGAQVHVSPAPVHVAPPQVEVAPPQIHYDQGYFAVPAEPAPAPPPPPPSPTERPYTQEPGERG